MQTQTILARARLSRSFTRPRLDVLLCSPVAMPMSRYRRALTACEASHA